MFLNLQELFDIVVMSVAMGYIFMSFLKKPQPYNFDPMQYFKRRLNWDDFFFAMAVTAPALVLHEFGHKFAAIGFGGTATLHAAYTWLAIAIILKLMNSPIILFVGAYVAISGITSPFQDAVISFAGPAVNLFLFGASWLALRHWKFSRTATAVLQLTKRVNLILLVFNMLPIPGFDGFSVFSGLYHWIF
jgi:Zn-dependent protease